MRDVTPEPVSSCRVTDCPPARPGRQALCHTFGAVEHFISQQHTDKLEQGIGGVAGAIMGLANYLRKIIHSCACCQSQQGGCLRQDIRDSRPTCADLPIACLLLCDNLLQDHRLWSCRRKRRQESQQAKPRRVHFGRIRPGKRRFHLHFGGPTR